MIAALAAVSSATVSGQCDRRSRRRLTSVATPMASRVHAIPLAAPTGIGTSRVRKLSAFKTAARMPTTR
jgi:hypothetical protein